jgi:hypothetical protein
MVLVYMTQLQIGFYRALGIRIGGDQCGTNYYKPHLKFQMDTPLIKLEKRRMLIFKQLLFFFIYKSVGVFSKPYI